MSDPPPMAHSVVEIHLYAAVIPCRACSGRGFAVTAWRLGEADAPRQAAFSIACRTCPHSESFDVRLPAEREIESAGARRLPVVINPIGRRSELIDVAQWLVLYRLAVDRAEKVPVRALSRAIQIEAGQCLDEALRFYPPDTDVPPSEAFFAADSLERFRDHPHLFARQRLIDLRAGLPTSSVNPPLPVSLDRPLDTKWWIP